MFDEEYKQFHEIIRTLEKKLGVFEGGEYSCCGITPAQCHALIEVDFLKGYIEDIPLKDQSIDVIMSSCVINLSEDKEKALSEAYRVLKNGGRIAIAGMVSLKGIPIEQQ